MQVGKKKKINIDRMFFVRYECIKDVLKVLSIHWKLDKSQGKITTFFLAGKSS